MIRSHNRHPWPAAIALILIALFATAAVALAAKPKALKGATYTGAIRVNFPIRLKISKNGKSVTANVPFPPLYCQGGGAGERQLTKPATISAKGTFSGKITYEFIPTRKKTATLTFSGKFNGHTVTGTARSHFMLAKGCDGSSRFVASAR